MLRVLGKEYMVDLAINVYKEQEESKAFEIYKSELLRTINNNIAGALGGSTYPQSWVEMTEKKPEKRTAKEIKTSILNKLHGMGGEEE